MYQKFDQPLDYSYKQQDPEYVGQPLDRQLANGPRQQGRLRDCLFCIIYILFWIAMIIIAVFAFSKGHPHLLAAPFDSTGNQCGYSQGYEKYQYGYYMPSNHSKFVCIDSCPSNSKSVVNCIWNNTVYPGCIGIGVSPTIKIVSFCYPYSQSMGQYADLGLGFFQKSISDMNNTWPIILSVLFMALIVSIIFLFFIRACGGCLVWTVILLYFALIITFGVISFLAAQNKININQLNQLNDPQLLHIIAYSCWGVAALSLLILLCSISKVRIATTVIKTTAQFTKDECQTILVPIFMFIAIAIFFTIWIVVSIYIFSAGQVSQCNGTPYACINWDVGVKRSLAFYFFGLFWNCQIAIGMCQFVIASTCAYWYFSHLNRSQASSPVCYSFCRALLYHFGSICLGSLILTVLVILQLILEFMHYSAKNQTLSADPVSNACFKCILNCLRCCVACFQRFIRFITRNAFIMMAITGDGFCSSAHQAFYLILRSGRQYAITHGVGYLIMLFGKLFISLACTFTGYLMITQIQYFSQSIYSPFMPTLMFFIVSFVVASLFMDVFAVGADTLLLCYCLQMDILRGLSYACPQGLKSVMDGYRQ